MNINLRKIFNWDIDTVYGPFTVYEKPVFGDSQVAGYNVVVRYKYHGSRNFFFDIDCERLWALYRHPQVAARVFAQKMREKQAIQEKQAVAHQK